MDRVEVGRARIRAPREGVPAPARRTQPARRPAGRMAARHRHRRTLPANLRGPAVRRLRAAARRLLATFRRGRMDDELREEIASHLAEATDDYVRRGMSPDDARRAALRSVGGGTHVAQ